MKTTPVQYAIPGRQIFVILSASAVLVGGIIGLAIGEPSALSLGLGVIAVSGIIWFLVRNIYGRGELTLTETSLEIASRHSAFCAGRGPVHIGWADCRDFQEGLTNATAPTPYVLIKTRVPRRTWIIVSQSPDDVGLAGKILEQANASRAGAGAEPLAIKDSMTSAGWRIAVVAALAISLLGAIGLLTSRQSGDIGLWSGVLTLGGLALSLWPRVFRARA